MDKLYPYLGAFHWLVVVILISFYFLPASLAWNKKKASRIISLNLFLGWTVVGWIIAFVWAITAERQQRQIKAILNRPTTRSVLCVNCGRRLPPGEEFCRICGAEL